MSIRQRAVKQQAKQREPVKELVHPREQILRIICWDDKDLLGELLEIEGMVNFTADLLYLLPIFVRSYKLNKALTVAILDDIPSRILELPVYVPFENAKVKDIYGMYESLAGEVLSTKCKKCGGNRFHTSSIIISLDEGSIDKYTCVVCG